MVEGSQNKKKKYSEKQLQIFAKKPVGAQRAAPAWFTIALTTIQAVRAAPSP